MAVLLLLVTGVAGGCAPAQRDHPPTVAAAAPSAPAPPVAPEPTPVREGREAPGARVTFVPDRLVLADGSSAPVEPAATRDGVLVVPEDVDRVGWWDGSARVGDPYGATVLAGHVDSREQGLGVLASLSGATVGDLLEVTSGGRAATYRVSAVEQVPKQALATTHSGLDQTGPHRLVLITCAGRFDPLRRSYADNLVVTAVPEGGVRG